jgi:tetratricopeptide (TPR) repeat protein
MPAAKHKQRAKRAPDAAGSPSSAGNPETPAHDHSSSLMMWALSIALVAITVLVFAPIRHHPFFSFDDPGYVRDNPRVKDGLTWEAVKWAMTSGYFANWHPLTWISHMLDIQLFGLNPGPQHVVNLLFHVADVVLLFAVFFTMTKQVGRSAFVAALFAIHPMHVESVAWISERKDVLSTFFWLLTTLAYIQYVRRRSARWYATVVVLFALGLMVKPMLVTLPCVLFLLDIWPLRRATIGVDTLKVWSRLALEKVPLLALAAASSVITVIVQRQAGAVESLTRLPIIIRAANAIIAYGTYLQKLIWPTRLAVLYPYPDQIVALTLAAHFIVLTAITVGVVRVRRHHPYLLVGWAWFLGTLVPVIGLVQVGKQSMADRYTYVPAIGLFILVAWGIPALVQRFRVANYALSALAAASIAALGLVARTQVGYWKSSISLWTHTIEVTGDNYLAENNIGWDYATEKRHDEAIPHYLKSVKLSPRFIGGHTNLALSLVAVGRLDEAIAHYNTALSVIPDNALVHGNLGVALAKQGKLTEAIAHYREAIRLKPDYDEAHSALGLALARQGLVDEAIQHYTEALRLNPRLAEAHSNYGTVLASRGMVDSAVMHFFEAVKLKPDYVDAHNNLGIALASLGKLEEAIVHFSDVVRLDPMHSGSHFGLGTIYQRQGRIADALREYSEALRINPANADAQRALVALQQRPK